MKNILIVLVGLFTANMAHAQKWFQNEPNSIDKVECQSTTVLSDLHILIVRTGDNQFTSKVSQNYPSTFLAQYQDVSAQWGHWWDFYQGDKNQTIFDLFTRGANKPGDNVEAVDESGLILKFDKGLSCKINDLPCDVLDEDGIDCGGGVR